MIVYELLTSKYFGASREEILKDLLQENTRFVGGMKIKYKLEKRLPDYPRVPVGAIFVEGEDSKFLYYQRNHNIFVRSDWAQTHPDYLLRIDNE